MDGSLTNNDEDKTNRAEDGARFLKVLGNPWRLRILALLVDEPKQVGELEEALGLGQAYVSQQLARLRAEGIVAGDRNGRAVHYRVVDDRVEPLLEALGDPQNA
ncbi:MAG: metalloregulator ArsR/SmtB family transcription factor [Pseudomonadota bacterium]